MLQTVEAIVDQNGEVRLLEDVYPSHSVKALLTLLEPVNALPKAEVDQGMPSVWQALQTFRANANLEALDIDTAIFDEDRKQHKEREIEL